jgi:hypothetical protein
MERLKGQRDAAEAALAKLPPRPEFDVATLVDGELSLDVFSTLPIARQRFLLRLAVHQVWIYSPDVPMDERVLVAGMARSYQRHAETEGHPQLRNG